MDKDDKEPKKSTFYKENKQGDTKLRDVEKESDNRVSSLGELFTSKSSESVEHRNLLLSSLNRPQKILKVPLKKFLANIGSFSIFYEVEQDRISILMLSISQDLLFEQFNTFANHLCSKTKKFVFKRIDNLYLTVISNDRNESTAYLSKYLELFHNLLRFRIFIRPKIAKVGVGIKNSKKFMKPLLSSLSELLPNQQSFFFNTVESVEIDRYQMRDRIIDELANISKQIKCVCHCIVLIDTKVLTLYSKPNLDWVLKPSDMINIVVLAHSIKNDDVPYYEQYFLYTKYKEQQRINVFLKKFSIQFSYKTINTNMESHFSIIFVCYDDPKCEQLDILKAKANEVKERLNIFDYSFLNLKSIQHFTMRHFYHYFPGMIHFVYIDRMRARIYSPKITSFCHNEKRGERWVKEQIWNMDFIVKKYKSMRYNEIVVYTKTAILYYDEWLISKDDKTIPFKFSNLKKAFGHFELYIIVLPFLGSKALLKYVKKFKEILKEIKNI